MSMTPAFSPGPWITQGADVGSVRRWIFEDLYEQCSFHIAEKMPSSVSEGSRPISPVRRWYSSGLRPCAATISGVTTKAPARGAAALGAGFLRPAGLVAAFRVVGGREPDLFAVGRFCLGAFAAVFLLEADDRLDFRAGACFFRPAFAFFVVLAIGLNVIAGRGPAIHQFGASTGDGGAGTAGQAHAPGRAGWALCSRFAGTMPPWRNDRPVRRTAHGRRSARVPPRRDSPGAASDRARCACR